MKVRSNKILDIVNYYSSELSEVFTEGEVRQILRVVFSHFLSFSPNELPLHYEDRVGESELLKLHFAFKDLKKQRPLQYVLGKAAFMDLDFFVKEGVLIPRPETEELVQWILDTYSSEDEPSILDIGTGSGCIPICLAHYLPKSKVSSVDVSAEALQIAQKNASDNKVEVEFYEKNALDSEVMESLAMFDCIVSNPPYVRNMEKKLMQQNVLGYEPDLALFVEDDDPLLFYRHIAVFAEKHLKPNGKLFFEINEAFEDEMLQLIKGLTFSDCEIRKDFRGKPRMLMATK